MKFIEESINFLVERKLLKLNFHYYLVIFVLIVNMRYIYIHL